MEQLQLDLGMEEYHIQGGGVLRFNPTDPNIYARFLEAEKTLEAISKDFRKQAGTVTEGGQVLAVLQQTDARLKQLLGEVFPGNDFQAALGGIHLLALCGDGRTVAETLFAALEKILTAGAGKLAAAEADKLLQEK